MAHSHHQHREHQVSHRRVHHILKGEPAGAKQHFQSHAFSKVTSKTAAENHDQHATGHKAPKRFARGGKVKSGQTNIAIVLPGAGNKPGMPMTPPVPGPMPGPGAAPPLPGPGGPGMPPPPMMRARGGRAGSAKSAPDIDGESTEANIRKMAKRAASNSYFRGGAATGVGREEKAAHMKRKGR